MNLVEVSCSAYGCYSNSVYESVIYLKEETYEKFKEEIDNFTYYIYDLDEKHSETRVETEVIHIKEENQQTFRFRLSEDDDRMWEKLVENIPNFYEVEDKEHLEVYSYIRGIDYEEEVSYFLTKTEQKAVEAFIKELKGEAHE